MDKRGSLHSYFKSSAQAALALVLALSATAAAAKTEAEAASGSIAFEVAQPAGFDDLLKPQLVVVEVFHGGDSLGVAKVMVEPGAIRFQEPAAFIEKLPALANPGLVLAELLRGGMPTNSQLVCTGNRNDAVCGRLKPDIVGIIYDPGALRVDLFVNPRLLAEPAATAQFLSAPDEGISGINLVSGVLSGSSAQRDLINLQNYLVVGDGAKRVRADLAYATGYGLEAEQIVGEIDLERTRIIAGATWTPGSSLLTRQKFLGFGFESQIDTRRDKDLIKANPLLVFLSAQSRVEVLRDGKIVATGVYPAGNQLIDTSGLPEGAYPVTLRIREASGRTHEETRFLTKLPRVPTARQDRFAIRAGLEIDDRRPGSLKPTEALFVHANWAHRVSEMLAVETSAEWSGGELKGELGAILLTPAVIFRASALGSSDNSYGAAFQAQSSGVSAFNYSLDARHVSNTAVYDPRARDPSDIGPYDVPAGAAGFLERRDLTQVTGAISYSLPSAQVYFRGSYVAVDGEESYAVGPSLKWELLRTDPFRVLLDGSFAMTDQGARAFLGISINLLGSGSSTTARLGHAFAGGRRGGGDRGTTASIEHSFQVRDAFGGDLNVGAFARSESENTSLGVSGDFNHRLGSVAGELIAGDADEYSAVRYSLAGRSGFFFGRDEAGVGTQARSDAILVVSVNGARESDTFDVYVNEARRGTLSGSESLDLALPAYRSYSVRIRPTDGLLAYDGTAREISLYPGNVASAMWDVKPVNIVFGRLVFPDGRPVANASLAAATGLSVTDANGYFQIEVPSGAELELTLASGEMAVSQLPDFKLAQAVANLGTLVCCDARAERPSFAAAVTD